MFSILRCYYSLVVSNSKLYKFNNKLFIIGFKMVLQKTIDTLAKGILIGQVYAEKAFDKYKSNRGVRASVNTIMLYSACAFGPDIFKASYNTKEAFDIIAPIASGIYALNESRNIKNNNWRILTQLAITSIAGYDIGKQIHQYHGNIRELHGIDHLITSTTVFLRNLSGYRLNNGCTAGTGAVAATLLTYLGISLSKNKK